MDVSPLEYRIVDPALTLARTADLCREAGITRVADVTALDYLGIPVLQAIRPGAYSLSMSQGKGVTAVAARVSAVMESLETWHAERVAPARTCVAARALSLPYRLRELPLEGRSVVHEDLPLDWVPARLWGDPEPTWAPLAAVSLDFRVHGEYDPPPLFRRISNGLASGNSLDEALTHAALELVERLSTAAAQEREPLAVDPAPFPAAAELAGRITAAGARCWLVDQSLDPRTPTYAAYVTSTDFPVAFAGYGCQFHAELAMLRALTEAAQSRLTTIAGARDDLSEGVHVQRRERYGGLLADQGPPTATNPAPPRGSSRPLSLGEAVTTVLTVLTELTGLPPLVVDLSVPGRPMHVVKVLPRTPVPAP